VLYADGYDNLESTTDPDETTYSFDGLAGSLDHVLANPAAAAMVTGVDIWNINADESIAFEYSRFNYNATQLYAPDPYRASDHDPEVVGLELPSTSTPPASSTVTATAADMTYGTDGSVHVTVTPPTATGTVTVAEGGTVLGTAAVSGGAADVAIDGAALEPGDHTLTVSYSGDAGTAPSSTTVTLTVSPAGSTTTAAVSPGSVEAGTGRASVDVTVSGDVEPTGTVEVYDGSRLLGSAELADGKATLSVGPFHEPGTHVLSVRYLGSDHLEASSTAVSLQVTAPEKVDPRIAVSHSPGTVTAGKTRATLRIRVTARGAEPCGTVRVQVPGHGVTVLRLHDGRATLELPRFDRAGTRTITVVYSGDDDVRSGTATETITVVGKKK
jgi:hypothetical protein